MPKKEKKKKDVKEVEKPPSTSIKLDKFEILSKIDELGNLAQNYKMQGNIDEAIRTAGKIVNLAMEANLSAPIKEQDKFIKSIANIVAKDHIISEIVRHGEKIKDLYAYLIESDNFPDAHELVETFKEKYSEISYFETIPLIMDMVMKDKKNWIRYQTRDREKVEIKDKDETEEFKALLNELRK